MEATNEKGAAEEVELGGEQPSVVQFIPEHEMPQPGQPAPAAKPKSDEGNGEPAAPAKPLDSLMAEEVADLRSQLADAKKAMANYERKVSRLMATQKRSVGKIPKRAADDDEGAYSGTDDDDATPEPEPGDDYEVTERANAITQFIFDEFPELAKDEMGRKCGQDAYYALRAEGLIVPGKTDDLIAAERIGKRGMKLLAAEKARAEREAQIKAATGEKPSGDTPAAAEEPKAPKTPMGAKPTSPSRKKSPEDEEREYEAKRGPGAIPRA